MTYEKATELLNADEIARAEEGGKVWGWNEADCWCDAHDPEDQGFVSTPPEWSLGTYCGATDWFDDDDDKNEAFELIMDLAARDEWDSYFAAKK